MGWWPAGEQSMMLSRRWASPMPGADQIPQSSGPRVSMTSRIRSSTAGSGRSPERSRIPAIPHMKVLWSHPRSAVERQAAHPLLLAVTVIRHGEHEGRSRRGVEVMIVELLARQPVQDRISQHRIAVGLEVGVRIRRVHEAIVDCCTLAKKGKRVDDGQPERSACVAHGVFKVPLIHVVSFRKKLITVTCSVEDDPGRQYARLDADQHD